MLEIIGTIKEKLKRYPDVNFEERGNSITIFPVSNDGFEVSLYVGEQSNEPFEVFFNGWHESFSDSADALECFAFGLSEECRLKEYFRGSNSYRWTVERYFDDSWQEESTTSLIFVPFWKAQAVRVLQNHLIPIEGRNE